MKSGDILVVCIIMLIILASVNIVIVFFKISVIKKELTGFTSGFVNITIYSKLQMNMSRDLINWSSGEINISEKNATLYTRGNNSGVVLRGNWSGDNVFGFIVENIGGINASLTLESDKNASSFFAGLSNTNQEYRWNVSNREAGACSGGAALGLWADVNTTSGGTKYCSQFDFNQANNEVYIDVLLTIPYDLSNSGEQSSLITVTADVAS